MCLHGQELRAVRRHVGKQQVVSSSLSAANLVRGYKDVSKMEMADLPIIEHHVCCGVGFPLPHPITEPWRHIPSGCERAPNSVDSRKRGELCTDLRRYRNRTSALRYQACTVVEQIQ